MLNSLENLASNNWPTMIGVSVVIFALGLTIAGKFDSKFGYVIAAVGLALGLYTLHVLGVF